MKTMKTFHYVSGGVTIWHEDQNFIIQCNGIYNETNEKAFYNYKNGLLHNENGPAVEWYNGEKEWCINGEDVFNSQENNLPLYDNLTEEFKKSIIKYELSK
jgi:c-di-AMP phosphodiesterase-like protein